MIDERILNEIVASVVKSMNTDSSSKSQKGVFDTMSEALAAVDKAYKQYRSYSIEQREKMIIIETLIDGKLHNYEVIFTMDKNNLIKREAL